MEVMVTPKRRATTQCPSSCSSTQVNSRSMNTRLSSPAAAPARLASLNEKKASRSRKVTCTRIGIPRIVPRPNDQLMPQPLIDSRKDEPGLLPISMILGELAGQLVLLDARADELGDIHG